MFICGESTFTSQRGNLLHITRYRCNSWRCQCCRPSKKKRLIKEAILGKPKQFLTLTAQARKDWTPDDAARHLVVSFRRMREEIQRSMNIGPIPFIAVFEKTKQGWPHLHILWRAPYVSQRWISRYMERRINSPIVDIRKIKGKKQIAGYVSKYIGKDPKQFKGCKMYWRNPAYIPPRTKPKPSPHEWMISTISLEHYESWYERVDEVVSERRPDRIVVNVENPI